MIQEVQVILPCLDEAQALPKVLGSLPQGYTAIVVDNGSTDASVEVAERHGATVVHASRRGYGSAVQAGLHAATSPVVAFCDADASFDMDQLTRVASPVLAGDSDLVLGRRRAAASSVWPLHARLANTALMWLVRRRMHVGIRDLGPMRAATRQGLLDLDLQDRRSGYPLELVLRAERAAWRIDEVDVDYLPRVGRSKVTGTLRGTLNAVADMSRLLRRHA